MKRFAGRMLGPLGLLLVIPFLAPDEGSIAIAARQASCSVTLPEGDVQGLDAGVSCAFLGIPYAASTAGDHRWKPPYPRDPWAPAVFDATKDPINCPSIAFFGMVGSISGSEDCLTVNVWVPDPFPTNAPVIVWLHTGAFVGASAFFAGSRGGRLAGETGVIVVAPNYRVGPFGFLAHSALGAESPEGFSGNYGLLDQRAALHWVRENIARFGGNPQNITLAGTSAGGQSVGLHLVSPASAGLFNRAIVQSAYPTSRWRSASEGEAQGDGFAAALGCLDPSTVVACMRSKSRDAVLTALTPGTQQVVEPPNRTFWEPIVDGVVIPDQPRTLLEMGAFHRVPTIVGSNRDEGWGAFITRSFGSGVSLQQYEAWVANEFGPYASSVLALYPAAPSPIEAMARLTGDVQFVCEGRRLARLIERTGTPTYLYSYEYEIDALSLDHVIHGVESNIIFGNNYLPAVFPNHVLTVADNALHATMAGYWTRFAATGNPNRGADGQFSWPPFTRPAGAGRGTDKYLIFDSTIGEGVRLREAQCDFFEPLFLRSALAGVPASAQ
jgi:para-nitrobenzyl esterase